MDDRDPTHRGRDFLEDAQPFSAKRRLKIVEPGDICPWTRKARDVSAPDRIGHPSEYDRDSAGHLHQSGQHWIGRDKDHIRCRRDHLRGRGAHALGTFACKAVIKPNIAAIVPAKILETLPEGSEVGLPDLV